MQNEDGEFLYKGDLLPARKEKFAKSMLVAN
jgi:hypothetical protein